MPPGREDAVILMIKVDGRAKIKKTVVYRKRVKDKRKYLRKERCGNYACDITAQTLRSKDEKGMQVLSDPSYGLCL